MNSQTLKVIIKVGVTAGLITWLLITGLQFGLIEHLSGINIPIAAIAVLLHILVFLILLIRWQLILGVYRQMSYRMLSRSYLIGLFSTNFLPSNVGGDFVRASLLVKQGLPINELLLCIVADRLIGVIVTLVLCVAGLSYFSINYFDNILSLNQLYLIGAFFIVALIIALPTIEFVIKKVLWVRKFRFIYSGLESALQLITALKNKPGRLVGAILLSFASIVAMILCYYVLGFSLGMDIPLSVLSFIVPISFIASAAPVSVGGLGVREGTIVFFLSTFDVPTEDAITLTVAYLFVLILVTTPGGLLILSKTKSSVITPEQDPPTFQ